MNRAIAIFLLGALALSGCAAESQSPPTEGIAGPGADTPAEYAPYYGVWSGKWDEEWDVTIVIDEIDLAGIVHGHYYWKEVVPGPWGYRRFEGEIKGRSLLLGNIRINLDPAVPDTATAFGDFSTDRTAMLRRLKPPS